MKIKIAGILKESVVDGPGIRMVVFCQGCPHDCPGCHNPKTHDIKAGYWEETDSIIASFLSHKHLNGLTISGGEPFLQAEACSRIAKAVKDAGKNIILFTGYTWQQLQEQEKINTAVKELLLNSDIVVDGPFIEQEKDLNLSFRGSKNQKVIDIQKSLTKNEIIEIKWGREAF
ncbi:MAG: anaerobic ribonucleoside-triphosphate reductase activating protein [Bacillota bacterium]|jgi:anaerobic ribonucleoside-triphosphate reductase activating protein